MTAHKADRTQDEPARKPYARPRLEVYGDIREVTNSFGMRGANDNGVPPMSKSQ